MDQVTSTVTDTVTVQPSPSISDATVVEMVLGKAVSLGDFAAHLGQSGNSAFFTARLPSLTGVTATQAQTLLSDGALYKAHAMSRAQIAPDLAPVSAPTAWETMAPLFAEDCGDLGCACDQLGDCGLCPPECGGGSAPPPDPVPGLAVVGVAWWPEIDPQSGQAWGAVDAVLQNPYGLNIQSATVESTANLSGGGVLIASNTVPANYPDHAIAEASTQNPPTQTTVYTTSGSYTLEQLSLIDLNGNPETGDQETWTVSPVSATWLLDATPTISLVGVIPNPLPAGSQGILTVYGNNLGTAPALSFVCEAGNPNTTCSGNDLTVISSSYTPQPPTTAGYIIAAVQAGSNSSGNYDVQVTSNGSSGFGFQAGGTGNSPTSAPQGVIPVNGMLSLSRLSLTQIQATASPAPGQFSEGVTVLTGSSTTSIGSTTNAGSGASQSVTFSLIDPPNPSGNGAPSPGGLAQITVSYLPQSGQAATKQFGVPTFGLSCYYTTLQSDWTTSGGACSSITIGGVTYSGSTTNPPNLTGTYCNAFLGEVELQGSGVTNSGTFVQYNANTGQYNVVNQIQAADGTAPVAGQTLARDRSIIPRGGVTVSLDGIGTNLLANDTGGGITGYRIDLYKGSGQAVCSGFSNPIVVGACSPGSSTCPASNLP